VAWGLIAPSCANLLADDWPQWLGPDHNAVTPESSGYPSGWPPKRLWNKNVGKGCTSPILAGGRLYTMGWSGGGRGNPLGTDAVLCLDARTGAEHWRRTYPCRYQSRIRTGDTSAYGGPSSTPTFDPETGYLYTLSIDGHLCCWDTKRRGAPVWAMNFHEAYKIPQRPDVGRGKRDYGHPGSPLLVGDQVAVEVGDDSGTVMAFDKKTGRLEVSLNGGIRQRWSVRDHSKVCTPVIYKGRIFTVDGTLKCLDLATGRRVWSGGQFGNGSVLVTAGDDRLIVFGKGTFALLDALGGGYRELARVDKLLRGICYPHVTLAGGILAVKDRDGNLICFDTT